ncbi:MAG: sialate O-acetylesterase [Phycisphaeraceae bacterium]
MPGFSHIPPSFLPRALACLALCLPVWSLSVNAAEQHPDANAPLRVYLLIGQSNMAGRAQVPDDAQGVIAHVYLLDDKNKWVPARNPLNLFSSIRKAEGMQKLGPGYGFALAMLKQDPKQRLGLVVNARGGSNIKQWLGEDAKYYKDAVARTKAALRAPGTDGKPDAKLAGVLWHQGEYNADKPDAYMDQLKQLIANLREDFDDPALPFVAGQIRFDPHQPINDVIAKLPDTVKHTAVASSEGLKTYDRWHFDTDSQLELGKRYAEQMLTLLAYQSADNAKAE